MLGGMTVTFLEISGNTNRVRNSFNLDEARQNCSPYLGPDCLQRF